MTNNRISHRASRFITAALASATTALISVSITTQPAQASWGDAVNLLNNGWGDIVQYGWSPWNKQVFMTNLSPQETEAVRNQYRSRADGVLHDRCINKVADQYFTGWRRNSIKTTHRWVIATRVENGKANCYMRMPNSRADAFIRARGW